MGRDSSLRISNRCPLKHLATMAQTRGIWLILRAVRRLWRTSDLDDSFRAEWDGSTDKYPVLHYGDARPSAAGPYCVFETGDPIVLTHQTGHTNDEEIQTLQVPLQFRIHAKSDATEDGKDKCIRLAMAIRAVFNSPARLDIKPDSHIDTTVEADFHIREGDDEWMWVVPYTLLIDACFDL